MLISRLAFSYVDGLFSTRKLATWSKRLPGGPHDRKLRSIESNYYCASAWFDSVVSRETVLFDSLSDTESREDLVKDIFNIEPSCQTAERRRRQTEILGPQFQLRHIGCEECFKMGDGGVLQHEQPRIWDGGRKLPSVLHLGEGSTTAVEHECGRFDVGQGISDVPLTYRALMCPRQLARKTRPSEQQ